MVIDHATASSSRLDVTVLLGICSSGRMVELVDTPDSKSGARKGVRVRVPLRLLEEIMRRIKSRGRGTVVPRKGSKVQAQKRHAMRRFSSRFDYDISEKEYQKLISKIQSGKAEFIDRQSNRISRWKVRLGDITAIAVYDKNRKSIVTFLTTEMLENPVYL